MGWTLKNSGNSCYKIIVLKEVLEYVNQNEVYNGPIETKKAFRLDMMQHAAMTT